MKKIFGFLEGKKTYIVAFLGASVALLHFLGVFNAQVANTLLTLLGFGGIAALHAKK